MRGKSLVSSIAVLIAFILGAGSAAAETPVKIGVAVPDATFLTMYIAEDQGFLKAEGLDAQLVQFDSDTSAAQGVTAGAIDMVNASIFPVLDSYVAGRDLVAFWGAMNQPVYIWYGPAKFSNIKDIKGGRVGVSSVGSLSHRISAWAILRSGLDPNKDVTYIPLGGPLNRMAALQAGQVDLIPASAPGIFILDQDGFKPLLDMSTLMSEFSQEIFYAKRANLQKNDATFKAVIRATIHAKHWGTAHPDGAAKILMDRMGAPAKQQDIYLKTTKLVLPYFPDDGHFPPDALNLFLEFYKEQGKIKDIPPVSAFTDARFIDYFKQHPIAN